MLFSEVIGHNKIKDVLTRLDISNRVGHAYIFEGPSGIGKLSMAKAFAQKLLCENPIDGDSCGLCKNCSQCCSDNNPDIQIVTNQLYDPSKKSTDILVDTIRSMKQDVYIKPFASSRKIYIVPKADTMNLYAQNSLLKVLEEPPGYCTIILIAENSNAFLPTILSRSTILKFYPISEIEIKEWLVENYGNTDIGEIEIISRMCNGSIGKAISLLENTEIIQLRNELLELIFNFGNKSRKSIYDFALFFKQNKDEVGFLFNVMQDLFRDIMYLKKSNGYENILNQDKATKLERFTNSISSKSAVRLLELIIKYQDFQSKNIGIGAISQCLGLELWEAINDRSYRSKV